MQWYNGDFRPSYKKAREYFDEHPQEKDNASYD